MRVGTGNPVADLVLHITLIFDNKLHFFIKNVNVIFVHKPIRCFKIEVIFTKHLFKSYLYFGLIYPSFDNIYKIEPLLQLYNKVLFASLHRLLTQKYLATMSV